MRGHEIGLTLGHRYKKNRDTNCSYWWPHYILQLSTHSVIYCRSDTVAKFQKSDLRSFEVTWSDLVYEEYQVHTHFMSYQYNAFWGEQRSERDSGPCTCYIATGYLQITCARHPTSQSLTVYHIRAQSVQPFSRSGTVTLHVRTCKIDPDLL